MQVVSENIFYIGFVVALLVAFGVVIKIILEKAAQSEKRVLEKMEQVKLRNSKLEESLKQTQEELQRVDAATKTSFIGEQLEKLKVMEDEVLKYKERLEEAKSIAQEAMNVKYEFLSNIREEVRTPLNSILTFADMLSHELQDATQLSYVKNIIVSSQQLLEMMDDIIELSRLESGAFDIHKNAIDVKLLFQSTLEEFQPLAKEKKLALTLEIDEELPDSLILDDKKVQDIFSNLLDNALKFTSSGFVKVKVATDAFNVINNSVDISIIVQDSGVGLEPSDFQSIFEMFEKRQDINAMEFRGSGLGLSIHRKMARMMDGDITVESRLGEGSTFTFSLRNVEVVLLSANEIEDDSSIDFSLIKPDGGTIMVVDEESESQEIIQEAFLDSALEVVAFHHPRDAIEALKRQNVDLIFIDVNILSIDENAVSKVIAKISQAPVVSLTATTLEDVVFVEGGANIVGHLKKPLSKVELFKISLKVLNSSHLLEEQKIVELQENPFEMIDAKTLELFHQSHDKSIVDLYMKAESTHDLEAIKIFAETLLILSQQYKITFLVKFSKELLNCVDLFDIEKINSMMEEYKLILKRLQNL